jgi:hypothetical protein
MHCPAPRPHPHLRALTLVLACLATPAWADAPAETAPDDALWINLGGFTHHANQSKDYNENNLGLGLEYRVHPDATLMVGMFANSVRQNTNYVAVNWQPGALGDWKLGAAIGLMNGYPGIARGGSFVAVVPMASYEGQHFGLNVGLIPTVGRVDGALVLQLKFRLR